MQVERGEARRNHMRLEGDIVMIMEEGRVGGSGMKGAESIGVFIVRVIRGRGGLNEFEGISNWGLEGWEGEGRRGKQGAGGKGVGRES